MSSETSSATPPSSRIVEYGVTVSLSGAFNPAIMLPTWFGREGLLESAEVGGAQDFYAHPDFVRFRTDDLSLETSREIFEISTQDASYEPRVVATVVGLLRALPHTPISEISIARYAHLPLGATGLPVNLISTALGLGVKSASDGQQAPTDAESIPWQKLVAPTIWSNVLQSPRLDELSMRGDRPDRRPGGVLVTVEPSLVISGGVFIAHIDIFQLSSAESGAVEGPDGDSETGADAAVAIMKDLWDKTREETLSTVDALVEALTRQTHMAPTDSEVSP